MFVVVHLFCWHVWLVGQVSIWYFALVSLPQYHSFSNVMVVHWSVSVIFPVGVVTVTFPSWNMFIPPSVSIHVVFV